MNTTDNRPDRFLGKVALVTGAARGQGRNHALRLAAEGADVVLVDACEDQSGLTGNYYKVTTSADLEETGAAVGRIGRKYVTARADVRDRAALRDVVNDAVGQLGGLDVVCANAGILTTSAALDITEELWRDTIETNLDGVWWTCQAALSHLLERGNGSIVITGSVAATTGYKNTLHYSASKHGVVGIMKSLANEMGPHGIRVNCVHPTNVSTAMIHNQHMYNLFSGHGEGTEERMRKFMADTHAMQIPWVEVDDVSNAVLFLGSDEARYVTGTALSVDAGFRLL